MDKLTVLAMFSGHYLLMAFLASLGVIQIAAAWSERRHLWLFARRATTRTLGILLVVGAIALFYLMPLWTSGPWGNPSPIDGDPTWGRSTWETLSGARNVNDTNGGLSGHWQALWFSIAWFAAAFSARAIGRRGRRSPNPTASARDEHPNLLSTGTRRSS